MGIPQDLYVIVTNTESSNVIENFCENIEEIFACPMSDIVRLCEKFKTEELLDLRDCLFGNLCVAVPSLKERELCQRKKKQ